MDLISFGLSLENECESERNTFLFPSAMRYNFIKYIKSTLERSASYICRGVSLLGGSTEDNSDYLEGPMRFLLRNELSRLTFFFFACINGGANKEA